MCGPEIFVRQLMAFGWDIIISCVVTTFKLHICIYTYTYKHTHNACIFLDKPIKYVFFWLFQTSSVLFILPASLFLYIVYSSLSTLIPHFSKFPLLSTYILLSPSPEFFLPHTPCHWILFFFFISFSFSLSQFLALTHTCHCLFNIFLLRKSLNFFSYEKFNLSINLLEQKALCTLVIKI